MTEPDLRHNARALIVAGQERRLLLMRFELPDQGLTLWATPGGGVEPHEDVLEGLERELVEEVGLDMAGTRTVVHVWSERVVAEGHATGYDGVINDFFLVQVPACFEPRGSLSDEELDHENIRGHRWWSSSELLTAPTGTLFGPRRLPDLFADLLSSVPTKPVSI